ncbi:MAG: BlaI/MecI/CopY family transcriptional regulator [Candidatus Bathyarchaeia archaeon]|jgi:predicted transcriptional regulator
MDFWTVVRTILEKNPGIKAKELIQKVWEKTSLTRSTIYCRLYRLVLRGKVYRGEQGRERGQYWLPEQKRRDELTFDETIRHYIWKETSELSQKYAQTYELGDYREVYERTMLLAERLGISTEQFREEEKRIFKMRRIEIYLTRAHATRIFYCIGAESCSLSSERNTQSCF